MGRGFNFQLSRGPGGHAFFRPGIDDAMVDERLGFSQLIEQHLSDPRRGKNTQFPLADLMRQSVCGRLAGYEDVNDAERLSQDPAFRLMGSEKLWDRGVALNSRLHSKPRCWPRRRTSPVWCESTAS